MNGGESGKVSVGMKTGCCEGRSRSANLVEVNGRLFKSWTQPPCFVLLCTAAMPSGSLVSEPQGKCTLALRASRTSGFCSGWSKFKQAHQLELELHLLPDVGDSLCCFADIKVEISSPGAHAEASADSIPSDLKIATNLDPAAAVCG